jgi:hypothetical protein
MAGLRDILYRPFPALPPLVASDYRPIAGYAFQRWGERSGEPYSRIRPLTEVAARRVWLRTLQLAPPSAGPAWDEPAEAADALPAELFPEQLRLELNSDADGWDADSVRAWLAGLAVQSQPVLLCYAPQWAVEVDWDVFCDHWLVFTWVEACAWPASEEWLLRCGSQRLVFGRRRQVP